MMRTDVLVVGSGPSGSTLARLLARRGWDVTLVDRQHFPRSKACGEFLNPGGLRALDRTGLDTTGLRRIGGTVTGWELRLDGTSHHAALPLDRPGVSLPRTVLDSTLVEAARDAGARFLSGTRYQTRDATTGSGTLRSIDEPGRPPRGVDARFVVGAGGLRCPVAARIGAVRRAARRSKVSLTFRVAGLDRPPTRGIICIGGDRTVGAAPSDSRGAVWNVTLVVPTAVFGRRIAKDPVGVFTQALVELGLADRGAVQIVDGPWSSGPFDRPTRSIHTTDTVLVGDAAGYFDPLTGQGLYQAVRSAELLAPHLHLALAGAVGPDQAFSTYARYVRSERRATEGVQKAVDLFLRTRARRRLVNGLLHRAPELFATILRVTTDISRPVSAARWWLGFRSGKPVQGVSMAGSDAIPARTSS